MNDESFTGIPGPGGSLGVCAVCEGNFLKSVLLGGDCISFNIGCIEQTMFAHADCIKMLSDSIEDDEINPDKLPESELKNVLLKAVKETA